MMNPCFVCGNDPQLEVDASNMAFMKCNHCGRFDYYNAWNSTNPIPEPDPLTIAHEQLAECHDMLETVAEFPWSGLEKIDIKSKIRDLLAKHRSESNASN